MIQQFGEAEGRRRVRLLVMDGMKLEVPAATMVDARDAILLADRADFNGASQSQIWAAFAKRGLGALAYAISANSVHVLPSFDLPSATGQLKFYDDPVVIGEPVRIVLQDSSLTRPSVRVQINSSSGDLEDVLLFKNGLNYIGAIGTTGSVTAQQNGVLTLATGDAITAFYVHFGAPGNQLISVTAGTRLSYTRIGLQPSFTFGTERRLTLNGTYTRVDLPFQFPYFSNTYGYVLVHQNGLLAFDLPVATSCTDASTLANYNGMAPLFANLSTNGVAQPKEGVYMSQSTSDSVTFHWIGETITPFARPGHPVNFSATLFQTGRAVFSYDPTSNADLNFDATFFGCGLGPIFGLSNGHGSTISGLVFSVDTTDGFGANTFNWDPPFGAGSIPVAKLEAPTAGQQVQGILTVSGIAYDVQSPIVRIDVYIDGIIRGVTTQSVLRPDFCTGANATINGCPRVGFTLPLDLAGLGLPAGNHTVSLRVSNSHASFTDVGPVSFSLTAGQSQLPRAKIENIANGATVQGNITEIGYALSDTLRITAVDLLIDGVT
jgi:hypothetical protein